MRLSVCYFKRIVKSTKWNSDFSCGCLLLFSLTQGKTVYSTGIFWMWKENPRNGCLSSSSISQQWNAGYLPAAVLRLWFLAFHSFSFLSFQTAQGYCAIIYNATGVGHLQHVSSVTRTPHSSYLLRQSQVTKTCSRLLPVKLDPVQTSGFQNSQCPVLGRHHHFKSLPFSLKRNSLLVHPSYLTGKLINK